jgi:hypothetical protein
MGKRGASVHKRERELKKAEKALSKRRTRETEHAGHPGKGPVVATGDDLRGYYGPPPESPRKGS